MGGVDQAHQEPQIGRDRRLPCCKHDQVGVQVMRALSEGFGVQRDHRRSLGCRFFDRDGHGHQRVGRRGQMIDHPVLELNEPIGERFPHPVQPTLARPA